MHSRNTSPRRVQKLWRIAALPAVTVAALSLTACGSSDSDSGKPTVVVGFYPQQYLAEQIGGDNVEVISLAKPGAEPHDMELSAQQVADISTADLVIYQKGMQPAVDDAVENEEPNASLDLLGTVETITGSGDDHDHDHGDDAEGEDHDHGDEEDHDHGDEGNVDPHVWLDPQNMKAMAEAIATELKDVDPDNASSYDENVEKVSGTLDSLDEEFTTGLAQCQLHDIVTTHTAFGYLAKAYGLEQIGITGLVPEENPTAGQLQEAQQFATEHGVTTIFYEADGDPGYAETIAEEVGASTAQLSPLEVAPESGDYVSTMQTNLGELQTALSCG